METSWTWNDWQQVIRKIADLGSGALVAVGAIQPNYYYVVGGVLTGVLSWLFWYLWNKNRPAAEQIEV